MAKETGPSLHTDPSFIFALFLFLFIGFCWLLLHLYSPMTTIVSYVVAANGAAFALCAYDKGIAGSRSLRVPERILYLSAIIGGPIGLLLSMHLLRHKTQKASFQLIVFIILALQVAAYRLVAL